MTEQQFEQLVGERCRDLHPDDPWDPGCVICRAWELRDRLRGLVTIVARRPELESAELDAELRACRRLLDGEEEMELPTRRHAGEWLIWGDP